MKMPNHRAGVDAGVALCLRFEHIFPDTTQHGR